MKNFKSLHPLVQKRMLECQVEQGNCKKESIFINRVNCNKELGGFNWRETEEGNAFWYTLLVIEGYPEGYSKYLHKLCPFQAGDKVYHLNYGWGVVEALELLKIVVRFDSGETWNFGLGNTELSFTDYSKYVVQERPEYTFSISADSPKELLNKLINMSVDDIADLIKEKKDENN